MLYSLRIAIKYCTCDGQNSTGFFFFEREDLVIADLASNVIKSIKIKSYRSLKNLSM